MEITTDFKTVVRENILAARANYGGSDADFSKSIGISNSIFSRLKKGEIDRIIADAQWINIGRLLGVSLRKDTWKVAKTSVYAEIEKTIHFCQQYSKSMILVDDCGIGKSFCTRHILRTMRNAFYVDCSQCKTKQHFIRTLAKTIGVDSSGKYVDVKANLKYFLNLIETPVIALDEYGDLEYNTILEHKEIMNGTEGNCGWLMIGADGLRAKMERGIQSKKVGYRELFSRFSDEFINLVPTGKTERTAFYSQLIGDVATVQIGDKDKVQRMIRACLDKEATLRYLETLVKMHG